MESKNKVLEALQMQPLSEEEKASRHILARLYGPIATTKEKTRNGRGYNAELWRRALADDIFREKVANKSLFLELGHPIDREETDMEKVCACIPELPKIVDGDLYAYVDILDTKNGQLLKTLCDYGFVPGISSRGSGDIMENDEVDPETFFLETWDIVQLPAVKKARLTMCESLDRSKTLSTALRESFAQMSEDDRKEAQAALERLELDIEPQKEAVDQEEYPEIPWAPGEEPLVEETAEDAETVDETEDDQATDIVADDAEAAPETTDIESEESDTTEETTDEASETVDGFTVSDFMDSFKDYDGDLKLEFKPIEIEGATINITEFVLDDEEEGKVIASFNYDLETSDNIENTEEETEAEESSPEDAEEPEVEDNSEEAVDDGDEEVIESLMAAVRQKDALEEEVLGLRNQLTVSSAEVSRLTEDCTKYKTGFMRVSELASKSTKLQTEVNTLNEQLEAKDATIRTLEEKISKHTTLTESINRSNNQVKDLQERLRTVLSEAETTEQSLREQVDSSRATAQKNAKIANAYKQKYLAVVEHYIASKATMLGVTTRDITSKLQEGYTIEDIDRVCDSLLNAGRPAFGFNRSAQGTARVKVNESFNTNSADDDLSDLLELAGLK